jgi:transcriptional regulator EpsA
MLSDTLAGDYLKSLDALESLRKIDSEEGLFNWARSDLQVVLPHELFICGIARHVNQDIAVSKLLCSEPSMEAAKALIAKEGRLISPIVKKWCLERWPQLFDSREALPELDKGWLAAFRNSELRNIAAHGLYDVSGLVFSYFNFFGLPHQPGTRDAQVLELLVPHMHVVLARVISQQKRERLRQRGTAYSLTNREREILTWLVLGKTNWEIAYLLKVSDKTVKTHLQRMFCKLAVYNRTQAVAKALVEKICRPS